MTASGKLILLPGLDPLRRPGESLTVWMASTLAIGLIGYVDYLSGVELRVFPMYYAPISLVAWYRGRSGALIVATLSTMTWVISNVLAGLSFSQPAIWVVNTLMQGVSFTLVGIMIATLRGALRRERELSRTDPLTSLLNTRAFYEQASRILALCRDGGHPVTIAYIDLDNFKAVNDRLGHKAGDDLLRRVAERLRLAVGPNDVTARLGGDEFAVLLPECGPREAVATLERLRSALADTFASSIDAVSASIGGVTFVTLPDDFEGLLHEADAGMYLAKSGGRNRVHHSVVDESDPQSVVSGSPVTRHEETTA